jgi:environmental stress-induced protein Ves
MTIRPVVSLDAIAAVPWKNGGGSTRTLAVDPPGASLDDFLWRVSLAEVASSGPFSSFSRIDRTIALWSGKGMLLESPGRPVHRLDRKLDAYEFPGEIPVQATPLDGPTIDFNLMVRRDTVTATLFCCERETKLPQANDLLLICHSGSFRIDVGGEEIRTLAAEQMLHVSDLGDGSSVSPIQHGSVLLCVAIVLLERSRVVKPL